MIPGRVGVVVNAWPTAGELPSGTGRHAELLARELQRRGAEVWVLVLQNDRAASTSDDDEDGVHIRRVRRVRPSLRAAHRNVSMTRALHRWLDESRLDLVHLVHPGDVGTPGPALVAAAGTPVVATVCDGLYGCAMGHLINPLVPRPLCTLPVGLEECAGCMAVGTSLDGSHFVALQRERRAHAAASGTSGPFVSDSAFIGAAVGRAISGDHRTIPWPVVVEPAPAAVRSGPLTVGFFGVPLWRKGIDVLLAAVEGLDGIQLQVHGPRDSTAEPAYAAAARALADRLPNVTWYPPYAPDEAAARMVGVDLVAVPSRAESLPGVAKEALAAGRPVLAATIAGLAEVVIDGRTGWLVDSAEPAAWHDALSRLEVAAVRGLHPRVERSVEAYVNDLAPVYAAAVASWPDRRREEPWKAGLSEAATIRAGDRYLAADERFQTSVADLEEGQRARAAAGLVRSTTRAAFDRLPTMPAWWLGVVLGSAWAAERAAAIARETPTSGRAAQLKVVARVLISGPTRQRGSSARRPRGRAERSGRRIGPTSTPPR